MGETLVYFGIGEEVGETCRLLPPDTIPRSGDRERVPASIDRRVRFRMRFCAAERISELNFCGVRKIEIFVEPGSFSAVRGFLTRWGGVEVFSSCTETKAK